MASHREVGTALAGNLKRLMDHHRLSQAELARKAKVGQSTLSGLLDTTDPTKNNPRAETIDKLADYFRVPAWQLMVPDLPLELLLSDQIAQVIAHYRDAGTEGRQHIARTAASEARYAEAARAQQQSKAS